MTAAIIRATRSVESRFAGLRPVFRPRRQLAGWLVVVWGAALIVTDAVDGLLRLLAIEPVRNGFMASLAAGLATGAGAAPILLVRKISQKAQDATMGFGAGVMLAAAMFSLILPGLAVAARQTANALLGALLVAAGVVAGGLVLWAADRLTPHRHFVKGAEGPAALRIKQTWLFVFAIALHNFPEGLAVGVAANDVTPALGVSVAMAIGLQNMPEGLIVALALAALGYARWKALAIALLTGLVEPVAGLFGASVVATATAMLPWALAFAGGAMLFVVSHEIIPESHRQGHETWATMGVFGGFVTLMILNAALA